MDGAVVNGKLAVGRADLFPIDEFKPVLQFDQLRLEDVDLFFDQLVTRLFLLP